MIRTDQMMKITDTINDFKAMCRDIQSSLQSTNKAFQILRQISNFEGFHVSKQVRHCERIQG